MTDFNLFKFKYGKEPRKFSFYVKMGLLFRGGISLVGKLPFLSEKQVFNFIDELQLKIGTIDPINDYVIKDDELIQWRIERVLNKSLEDYENQDLRD